MAVIQRQKLFTGYSTVDTSSKVQQFSDIELIKRDLLNNFYTRPGERVMMPTYGCGIWDLLFEPFDDVIKDAIIDECQNIFNNDSRVQVQSLTVTQYDQGIQIQADLLYIPYNVINTFSLQFDQRSAAML